jgi:hypothetical protein
MNSRHFLSKPAQYAQAVELSNDEVCLSLSAAAGIWRGVSVACFLSTPARAVIGTVFVEFIVLAQPYPSEQILRTSDLDLQDLS